MAQALSFSLSIAAAELYFFPIISHLRLISFTAFDNFCRMADRTSTIFTDGKAFMTSSEKMEGN
jgi:hypothetical protein